MIFKLGRRFVFLRRLWILLSVGPVPFTEAMAQTTACPSAQHSVANLTLSGTASAGLATATLRWLPTAMGNGGATGYVVVVSPPVFDYQIDRTVLNQQNPTDTLVINSRTDGSIGLWAVNVPSNATSVIIPSLALSLPYSFRIWTEDAFQSAYQGAFPAVNLHALTNFIACFSTSVAGSLIVTAPPDAPVWGVADTHTHPFADDAYDQGRVFFYNQSFGPKDQVLTKDIGVTSLPSGLIHQVTAGSMHMQNPGFNQPSAGWPDFDKFPSYNVILHQEMYSDWLYRAFLGGLHLIVAHAVNNGLLCVVSAGIGSGMNADSCDDVAAVQRQLNDARRMEAYLDAQCLSAAPPRCLGPHRGWFHIVTSPQEARSTINAGQLAVVLGIEVDQLFGCAATTKGLDNFRIHDCSRDDPPTEAFIQQQVQAIHNLGVRHVFIAHLADSAFAGMAIYDSGEPFPWSLNNEFVNGNDFKTEACIASGYGFNYNDHLTLNSSNPLEQALFTAVKLPLPTPGSFASPTCNARGLQPLGRFLVNLLRQNGILVDMDHLSLETWAGANGLESLLTVPADQDRPYYFPVVAGHTGPNALAEGQASERGLNDEQFTFLRRSGGLAAMGVEVNGPTSLHATYRSHQNTLVANNCDDSTSRYAQGYLYFVDAMGGPSQAAVAIASDQSLNKMIAPRFNQPNDPHAPWHTPSYNNACDGNTQQQQAQVQNNPISFTVGPALNAPGNQPSSYYFAAAAGPGVTPPRVYLWTGERAYDMSPHRMWDFNSDGLAHIGLYPEFIQDLQNVGVSPAEIAPLFNSAERYISAWQAYSSAVGNPDNGLNATMGTVDPVVGGQVKCAQQWVACGAPPVMKCIPAGAFCPGSKICPVGQVEAQCGDPPAPWCGNGHCPTCPPGETMIRGVCVKGSAH